MSVVKGASLSLPMKVTYTTTSWLGLVVQEWGSEWGRPDIGYEWSNGQTRTNTDMYGNGIYNPTNP